ncbi:MAG: hypothetical protein IPH07_30910 [Deltaproteobacteria bacterium]|nr:hypothetical protein [Deltaproteobacteria bacterium]MBK8234585.1 hypothetical protein [Deltaproteobacteria bacterium]MBK8715326.1 hypothetical protein [Deltaproteobacteria bacterium]MBP7284970.1 hypothetical protein [Nannocystaceae bacterium]
MGRGQFLLLGVAVAGAGALALVHARHREAPLVDDALAPVAAASLPSTSPPATSMPTSRGSTLSGALGDRIAQARWIAVGAGAWPEATQVQIEQDVGLAREVLGERGVVLFAAGADAAVVQVQRPGGERDPLGSALADLFAPRGGRNAEYRAPNIPVDAPATAAHVLDALDLATSRSGDPLLVFVAGHGDVGAQARANTVALWAGSDVTPEQVASVLEDARRPVRLVVTTCFSGGFAELVFDDADEASGPSPQLHCGLFAAPWDLEAAGCDPNPERAEQEGYAMHFLEALRGRGRDGEPLTLDVLDYDHDGVIGLLDAHTRVRIASTAADVPTTTSERWLRRHAPSGGPLAHVDLPEEDAVIEALLRRVGLDGRGAAEARLAEAALAIDAASTAVEQAQLDEDAAFRAAAGELLARWPVLDDPWHPEFATVYRHDREEIARTLAASSAYAQYLRARERAAAAQLALTDHEVTAAPLERLVRAYETRELAGRLAAAGGAAFERFEGLRACERARP